MSENDTEKVKLLREKCNHDMLKSENEYVNMLEVLVKNVFKPLHENSDKLGLKPQHVQFVYLFLEHMLQFHMNFLSVINDALNIVPDFYKYSNFVQMYDDYLGKFDSVLKVFAEWKSMEFRSFVSMRLESDKVKKHIEAPVLCMLPWYLYNPFERLKVYYKFLRDLQSLSREGDDDKKFLDDSLAKFRKVYHKIKQNEKRLRTKTKLLEVQLQMHGDFKTIVKDDRYFIMSKPCQIRRKVLHKKYKGITLYLFNDLLVLASVRGKYKGGYSLYNKDFQIEKTGKDTEGEFSVGLTFEKTKRVITFANDEQRDSVMEKVVDAFRKCQERASNASPEQKDLYHEIAKKETQTPLEISQSSTEHSVSLSQSDTDGRGHVSKASPFPPLEQIYENSAIDEEVKNPQAMNGNANQSTNAERSVKSPNVVSPINTNGKTNEVDTDTSGKPKSKDKSPGVTSPKQGNTVTKDAKDEKVLSPRKNQENPQPTRGTNGSMPQSKQKPNNNAKSTSKANGTDSNGSQLDSNISKPNEASPEISDTEKDKIIMELKQTIQELQDLLHKKDDHIKTLELSNESIRNTLLMTQNQYFKLQQEYDILNKRVQHNRTHSLALSSDLVNPSTSLPTIKYAPPQLSSMERGTKQPTKSRSGAPALQRSMTQLSYPSLFKQ